jgi:hypothetical protein
MDFTATVKGRKVPIGTVRRIAAAEKACPKLCYSRPEAVPGRGGRRQRSQVLDSGATRPGHWATSRRFRATGAACRGRRLSSASVRSCSAPSFVRAGVARLHVGSHLRAHVGRKSSPLSIQE